MTHHSIIPILTSSIPICVIGSSPSPLHATPQFNRVFLRPAVLLTRCHTSCTYTSCTYNAVPYRNYVMTISIGPPYECCCIISQLSSGVFLGCVGVVRPLSAVLDGRCHTLDPLIEVNAICVLIYLLRDPGLCLCLCRWMTELFASGLIRMWPAKTDGSVVAPPATIPVYGLVR